MVVAAGGVDVVDVVLAFHGHQYQAAAAMTITTNPIRRILFIGLPLFLIRSTVDHRTVVSAGQSKGLLGKHTVVHYHKRGGDCEEVGVIMLDDGIEREPLHGHRATRSGLRAAPPQAPLQALRLRLWPQCFRHDPRPIVARDDGCRAVKPSKRGVAGLIGLCLAHLAPVVVQEAHIDGLDEAHRATKIDVAERATELILAKARAPTDGVDGAKRLRARHIVGGTLEATADVAAIFNVKYWICRMREVAAVSRLYERSTVMRVGKLAWLVPGLRSAAAAACSATDELADGAAFFARALRMRASCASLNLSAIHCAASDRLASSSV